MNYEVNVIETTTGLVVKTSVVSNERKAEMLAKALDVNLNHERYHVEVVHGDN